MNSYIPSEPKTKYGALNQPPMIGNEFPAVRGKPLRELGNFSLLGFGGETKLCLFAVPAIALVLLAPVMGNMGRWAKIAAGILAVTGGVIVLWGEMKRT
jgi:hypothetical protein